MGNWCMIVLLLISSTASLGKDCPSNILKKFLSYSSKIKAHYHNGETIYVTCLADSDHPFYDYDKYDGSDTEYNSVALNCTDGKWIGRYPECFKNCSRPDDFAILDPDSDLYALGDNVTVTKCIKNDSHVEGDTTFTCMADGTWTGSARCNKPQKSCNEQPPTIKNAYIAAQILDEYSHGTVLRYKCGQAYDQTGRHSVTCQDGRWIQDSPNMSCNIGQCSPIYDREIDNGRVKNIVGEVGTYAEFECYNGYELEGKARILCMADRKWYPEFPRCIPISCPSPKQPSHGRLVQEAFNGVLNIYQSIIRYDCDKGYRLVGPQFRKCQADRTWSGDDTKCEEIVCEEPKSPENGNVYRTDNSAKVGSQIEYICDEHHIMVPSTSQFAICTERGYWSTPSPQCIKSCMVSPPSNGLIRKTGWKGEILSKVTYVPVNTQLIFTCDNRFETYAGGYIPVGRLTCENGLLHPGVPECRPQRCKVEEVSRLLPKMSMYSEHGVSLTVSCPVTMELVRTGNYLNDNETIVSCNKGIWIPGLPHCIDKRCIIPTIGNSRVRKGRVLINPGGTIVSGEKAQLECFEGFELHNGTYIDSDRTFITCNAGSFIEYLPSCKEKRCKMETDSRLLPEMSIYLEHGVSLTVSCPEKMELVRFGNYINDNETMVSCNNGIWIPGLPQCIDKRCILPTIDNSLVRTRSAIFYPGEKIYSGVQVQLECFVGFELHNGTYIDSDRTLINCNKGSFIENLPSCKEKRCKMEKDNRLLPEMSIYSEHGVSLTVSCPEKMELVRFGNYLNDNETMVSCNKGIWNPGLPQCIDKRCISPTIENSLVRVGEAIFHPGENIYSGVQALLECFEGFELHNGTYIDSDRTFITCNAGSIFENLPSCKEKRCQMDRSSKLLPQIHFTESGSSLNVSCPDNMEFAFGVSERDGNGESVNKQIVSVFCRNGSWTPDLPHCEFVCEKPSSPENGQVSYTNNSQNVGSQIQYSCDEYHTLEPSTSQFAICTESGYWSTPKPQCIKMCKPPVFTREITSFIFNGIKTKPDDFIPHDESIEAVCIEGYIKQGILTCKAGIWTGNSTCEIEVCNKPAFQYFIIKNGTLVSEDRVFSPGTKLNASCDTSFTLYVDNKRLRNGTSIITECRRGKWKPNISCKKNCTLPTGSFKYADPKFKNETKKEGDQIMHGRKMVPVCPSNHNESKQSTCLNGIWVPSFEGCVKDIGTCSIPNAPGMQFAYIHNGTEVADGQIVEGDKVVASCKFGYEIDTPSISESGYEYDYSNDESIILPKAKDSAIPISNGTFTCRETGKWEPEIHFTCKQIICRRLDEFDFENGGIAYSPPERYNVGTVASFTCNPGYTRDGPANRTCQEDGTWSDTCVTCQSDKRNSSTMCPAPCVPDWARKTGSYIYDLGSIVEFQCLPTIMQYSGDSSNIRHCVNGNKSAFWNGTQINCKGLRDVTLRIIADRVADIWENISRALGIESNHVRVAADEPSRKALKILQYWRDKVMKDKPKSLIPDLIIVMELVNKKDVAVALRNFNGLEHIRCKHPSLNGTVKPDQSDYLFGQSVILSSCNDGYMMVNQSYLVCTEKGTWFGNSTCRHAICNPECGIHGKCVKDNECRCSEGLSGKTCDEKVKSEVECESLSANYTIIWTGVVQGKLSHQTVVEISCNDSQAPFDDIKNATCNKGVWNPWKPFCQNKCSLEAVPGTRYNYNISRDNVLPGSVSSGRRIKVTCETGYIPHPRNSDVSICINGVWEPDILRCEKRVSCATPSILNVMVDPSKNIYAVNENVSLTGCLNGLELVGSRSLLCLKDGSWHGDAQCTSYCTNGVAYWKEMVSIQYKGNNLLNLGWVQNKSECSQKCEAEAECTAVHVIEKNKYYHCKLLRQGTELYRHSHGVIIERVCNNTCLVSKDLDKISLHNGDSPYFGEKVQDGMVLSIKCKFPGLTASPGHVTCMGGKWSHPIEKITCLSKGLIV